MSDGGCSSTIARHAVKAYLVLFVGMLLSFALTFYGFNFALDRIEAKAKQNCVAGNARSRIQLDDLIDGRRQAERFNFQKFLNVTPEQAANLRNLTIDTANKRIVRVPFQDCTTGRRLPPTVPPPPGS